MRKVCLSLCLVAAVLPGSGRAAQTPALTAQDAPLVTAAEMHQRACNDLASIVVNDGNMLPQIDNFMASFSAAMKPGDGSIGDLDGRYPGLKAKVLAAMLPVLKRNAMKQIPLYRADISELYCANLTTTEARKAAAGMRQPAFQAFIGSAVKNINYDRVTKEVVADKDVTARSVSATYRASGARVAKAMTPAQLAAVGAFLQSPVGRKLGMLNPQKAVIDAKWFNHADPANEKEISGIVTDTIVAHVALTDKEVAERMREAMTAPDVLAK